MKKTQNEAEVGEMMNRLYDMAKEENGYVAEQLMEAHLKLAGIWSAMKAIRGQ